MTFDFNRPVDRGDNFSAKWDERELRFGRADVLPLWVADMDLPACPAIVEAIERRNRQAIYGYTSRPASYFEAVQNWQEKRHNWRPETSLMAFCLGVVPALSSIVFQFSRPGDAVAFFTPVYSEFFDVVQDWERKILPCPLQRCEEGENAGRYDIDFAALEAVLAQKPAFFILCHPHNPLGRVWTVNELERVGELCLKYGVLMVSDEIHADIMLFGRKHTPLAAVSPAIAARTITCISATKTFNLAGLQASTTIFPDAESKARFQAFWNKLDIHRNNCFSLVAVEAAYRHGEEWLDAVLRHFEGNMIYVRDYLAAHIPAIKTRLPEATYLMWLDCRGLGMTPDELKDFLVNKARLALSDGRGFGQSEGAGFMRLNAACPRPILEEAMGRLKGALSLR